MIGVRESGLELGAGWWGAVQAPLPATLAPAGGFCALPPPGPLLGRGSCARQHERFTIGMDGLSRVRA